MEDSILIREAKASDTPLLLSLVHAAFEEYRGRLDPPSGAHAETATTLNKTLQSGFAALAILGEAAGCVFYFPRDHHMYVGRLSVLPAFRAVGVGKKLMTHAEQRARSLGFRRVEIGVRIALPHLHAFYSRLGYVKVREEAHPGYTRSTSIVMAKQLD